ncbi:PT domain-containing protein [Streptomyces sp. NPDC058762]|uniref:PT domain-containing protein n=1 Tax=Streptomyces sp. NPDC058762 TaxID=3346629 RepID=UPI0036A48A25
MPALRGCPARWGSLSRRECPAAAGKLPAPPPPPPPQARRTPGGRGATGRPDCAVSRAPACGPVPRWARRPAGSPNPATRSGHAGGGRSRRRPAARPRCRRGTRPWVRPSNRPSACPSNRPTDCPSNRPTDCPSSYPSGCPSRRRSGRPLAGTRSPGSRCATAGAPVRPSARPPGRPG